MKALIAIDASAIVPGHGPVEHDKEYVLLVTQALAGPYSGAVSEVCRYGEVPQPDGREQ